MSLTRRGTDTFWEDFDSQGGLLNSVALPVPSSIGTTPVAPATRPALPDALQRAVLAAKVATENKATQVLVLDLRKLTPVCDYFVLATGSSRRTVHTIVEEVDAAMRGVGDVRTSVEGYESSKWVIQDYGDVMVHVFDSETREYYKLEELWADAVKIDWENEID